MSDLQELIIHLKNLQDAGHKEFNINVDWLLGILDNTQQPVNSLPKKINLDGGKFN
tara:strand:+ start:84 stop:251 length:168 start_codon:yes stop_codon:yes gene_type:complete